MILTTIEYDTIITAIESYRAELVARGDVGDLSDESYSQPEQLAALDRVERYILSDNIPY